MLGSLKGRIAVILLTLVVAGWYIFSNGLKLGLDLQGGMHLKVEVADPDGTMTPEAMADATDRALQVLRTRIDQFGVEEPLIQKSGDRRIIVELPGVDDEERAKDIIQRAAFLEFRLLSGGRQFREALPRIDRAIVAAIGTEGLPESAFQTPDSGTGTGPQESIADLVFGNRGDTAAQAADSAAADSGSVAADDEPESNIRPLSSLLLASAGSEHEFLVLQSDVERVRYYLDLPEVQAALPRGIALRWHTQPTSMAAQLYRVLYVLEDPAFMSGEDLVDATAGRSQQTNEAIVMFELNRRGGRTFEQVTGRNIGERIAIVLDGQVHSAPVVNGRIGQRGEIQLGGAPLEEARDLALVLRAGALPAPLEIIEERSVGPSLGQDSIDRGRIAGIIGLALVLVIMAAYYRVAGILAIGALFVYVVILLGGLAGFNATLTLPGIAGLILSIGMAVDANVLIFERIREELAAGRVPRIAVEEGFKNAMSAIVDSNLTTLATALILFNFGTGPVRGFAVVLSIGIIASFFSAVYVTRTLFMIYLERRRSTAPLSI
ncbi:MAG TPA: protein translocase subunit SecD [Longimicrobiales bacterium]|nr:protein translocase subunit SecD [Longimicrobiales bacterium]